MIISAVTAFLSAWLHDHILAADMKLAAALKQQHSSAPVAQLHSRAASAHVLNQ